MPTLPAANDAKDTPVIVCPSGFGTAIWMGGDTCGELPGTVGLWSPIVDVPDVGVIPSPGIRPPVTDMLLSMKLNIGHRYATASLQGITWSTSTVKYLYKPANFCT